MRSPIHSKRIGARARAWQARKVMALAIGLLLLSYLPQSGVAGSASTTSVVAQQILSAPLLTGTFQVVNSGPGDQINPHIDCNLASYTNDTGGSADIHYFNFTTSTDAIIPTAGVAFLSDVSGTRVVYTNLTFAGSQIGIFDTATNTTTTVPGGNQRTNPSIGGALVAFEDRSFSANPNESEIVAYDLTTGTTTRLTTDALMDSNPSVSPDGQVVVFQKCQTTGFNCDVYVSRQTAPGVFTTAAVTGAAGEDTNPDTNGTLVVYTSTRAGETDVFYQPVAGGTEIQLSITGNQHNPSISGNLIAFESQVGGEYDIFVYDTVTGNLFQVTNTPVDETLNDITVCGATGRIVYSAPGSNGDFDVFAFTFSLSKSAPDQIDDLIALVRSFNLHHGIENSLIAKLQDALAALSAGDTATACSSLNAFINEVQAQAGMKIAPAPADRLIKDASQIKQTLDCQ